ncbi:UNVERIFIED_CONTAM: hypothetical protein Slati_1461100 [Sesamum latifolium]|uniref:Reverse transcriptase zinc-binding domain-containing protein n=1 Tax=Sesamum latifolium TaxID=2727402 RepID=A0AAW2X4U4_9LAMI
MVFSRNVEVVARSVLANILGVNVVPKHDKYLGLPTMSGRSKKELFEEIKECIWKKLHTWSSKQLSQAGRTVLLKTVLQTIPTIGWSPSYTWRSIWGTRDVLVAGLHWKVGDDSILDIKLTDGERDSLVWHFNKHDRFSVRSAYSMALCFREEAKCSGSAQSWDFLWSSKAPPGVLLFAWRCAQDALPTTVHLRSRGVKLDVCCGCYGIGVEDVLHVLFHCSLARLDWAISDLAWESIDGIQTGTKDWFREVHQKLGRWDWDYLLTICWSIWKARNMRLFEGRQLDAQEIIQHARRVVDGVQILLRTN